MCDSIRTKTLIVDIQENGIIRNDKGIIIARTVDGVGFDSDKIYDTSKNIINELKDFCIWMTGCGYEFTKHKYFIEQRDKLLK